MKEINQNKLQEVTLIKSLNLFPVVGVGASAGGLEAFKKLLKAIPIDSGMAFVLVQHLDPNHESLLPDILQKFTKTPVVEIVDDTKVYPNHIYVIPSNKILVATDGVLLLTPRPAKGKTNRNLPIDLFFTSLAAIHQDYAIGVVLSGTATDGTLGLKAIKENGGITIAQDEASADYSSMPNSAVEAGVVDFILPPEEIPKKLLEITNKITYADDDLLNFTKQKEDVFRQILSLLRIRKGVDFTYYKQTTIRRRILRRIVVNKNEEPAEYLHFLKSNIPEQDLLYQDMLIPVTSFFRDKKVFDNLCQDVFPSIIKNKIPGEITRLWIAGCSTGQEVYSFAICFNEFLGNLHEKIQIFGTDLSEPAILKARLGVYDKNEISSVSIDRLKKYFTPNNGGFQVNKNIRDMCVFAHHNFLKDPPFGKMDCISCRNVLIYMEPHLQKKALATFHYALNPKGFLLLGQSETTGSVPDLFVAAEKNNKLYTRKDVPSKFIQVTSQRSEQVLSRAINYTKNETLRSDFQKTADDILLSKYTPPCVIVNEAMDIVHFRGNTSNFLEQAAGKPSHNLLKMAKNGLGFELRNILHKVKTDKLTTSKNNIPLNINGAIKNIGIEAILLPNTLEPYYLILFHNNNFYDYDDIIVGNKKKSSKIKKDEKDIQVQLLENELAQAREDMRGITEDQEASNEELQSANEELLSGSEELQSLNEELETSKEELQSTNEELTVLNLELNYLNELVTDARNYAESIIKTLHQPLLVLDQHLRVKTANKSFYDTFKVTEKETEGFLIYDLGNRQWNIPELRTLLEEILPQKTKITNYEVTNNFETIGNKTILLNAIEITREKKEEKLILLSIEDISEKKNAIKAITESEHRFNEMVNSSLSLISICIGKKMVIEVANSAMLESWGKGNIIGQSVFEAVPECLEQGFDKLLLGVYNTGKTVQAYEMPVSMFRNGINELVYYDFIYQAQRNSIGEIIGVAILANEVTQKVEDNKKLLESAKQFSTLADNIAQFAWMTDETGYIHWYNQRWYDYTGTTLDEMKGWGWQKVHHPDYINKVVEKIKIAFETGEIWEDTFPIRSKTGEYRWFLSRALPIKNTDGKVLSWFGTNTDITDQIEANKKAEVAQKIAEDATKSKQQFLSNMSHEIRTPMNAIVGFTNVMLKTTLNERQTEYINAIKSSGDSLLVLINDILDLAKVDAGKTIFQQLPFKLCESVKIISQLFKIKIEEKNIEFIIEYDNKIPEVLLGDATRLHQIIINLVNNAIKFTNSGKIIVSIYLVNEDKEKATIRFSVMDTGIGIPANKLQNIFTAFEQAHSESSFSYGGTGLGLAIVKQLVEHQGGNVTVTSKEFEGSTFTIDLSFVKCNEIITNNIEVIDTTMLQNIKILVAEDVKLNQLLLKILLENFGVEVDLANNGKEVLEKLKIHKYDIILMDLQMPQMNGFEATEYIRNVLKSDIPIIALTADVTSVDFKKCKKAGMDDYMSKPIDEKILYKKIAKYLPLKNCI